MGNLVRLIAEWLSRLPRALAGRSGGTVTKNDVVEQARLLLDSCREELDSLRIDTDDDKQVLAAILFARQLEVFRALASVLEESHIFAGRILARSLLEAGFTLIALEKDERTLDRYVVTSETDRLKWVNQLLDARSVHVPGLGRRRLKAMKEEISADLARLAELGITDVNVEDLARWAGLHDWYLRQYALWSKTTHASVQDFRDHLVVSPDGGIEEVDLHSRPDEAIPVLSSCGLILLKSHTALVRLFGRDSATLELKYESFFRALLGKDVQEEGDDDPDDEGT